MVDSYYTHEYRASTYRVMADSGTPYPISAEHHFLGYNAAEA